MANHLLNYSQLFGIIILLVAAWSMMPRVVGDSCSQDSITCSSYEQCDQECKANHPGGQVSCSFGLCTCLYCVESPPSKNYCTGGSGLCAAECDQDCCNTKCASKYTEGAGYCSLLGDYRVCLCQYVC
ncbi:unnamed protein product [Lupinus luteus]|uniref:Defensin-like protein n=1 Tax=Lupinus luteus TaxID=3873 RepID=A0AAV1WAT9_LUPLU